MWVAELAGLDISPYQLDDLSIMVNLAWEENQTQENCKAKKVVAQIGNR